MIGLQGIQALLIGSLLREPEVGFRRVPLKGSPLYYLGIQPLFESLKDPKDPITVKG